MNNGYKDSDIWSWLTENFESTTFNPTYLYKTFIKTQFSDAPKCEIFIPSVTTIKGIYGFSDNELIKVVVQKDGKVLRTLELGKNSSTYQQVYGKIDNSKDVLLISGNPKLTFDVTFEDLKSPVETAPENPVANSTAE